MIRAAVLAVRMSLEPVLRIDVMRFLRVPAIVLFVGVRRRSCHLECGHRSRRFRRSRWESGDCGGRRTP